MLHIGKVSQYWIPIPLSIFWLLPKEKDRKRLVSAHYYIARIQECYRRGKEDDEDKKSKEGLFRKARDVYEECPKKCTRDNVRD